MSYEKFHSELCHKVPTIKVPQLLLHFITVVLVIYGLYCTVLAMQDNQYEYFKKLLHKCSFISSGHHRDNCESL